MILVFFIFNDNRIEQYFLISIDRYLKNPTAEVFNIASAPNVVKFLISYICIQGVPISIRVDQAKCLTGENPKNFCKNNNVVLIYALADDHIAIGLVENNTDYQTPSVMHENSTQSQLYLYS